MHSLGLGEDHLLQRYLSQPSSTPLPLGSPRKSPPYPPTKTVYGVFNTPLNAVWDTVAPQICKFLKSRKIRYSAIKTARFVTHSQDEEGTIGPIVIWIATDPTTTTAKNAHDASPAIPALLKANRVEALLGVTYNNDPTYYVRRFLTAAPGMPIAAVERGDDDAQGSVALFLHENKDKHGAPSAKVFDVSNCHVLCKDTTVEYEVKGPTTPRQHIRLAGFHRFQRGLNEIGACIASDGINADLLARGIVGLKARPKSEDPEEATKDEAAAEAKREKLTKVKKGISILEAFRRDTIGQWGDIARRNIGHVDWVPKISVDGSKYTKDIGTFEVDAARFKAQFKGNVVDLESKFTPWQLTSKFYPQSGGRTVFKFPTNRQLRISGCVMRESLALPDCFDGNGEPCLIVVKDGNTTDLTVGRYAGLEAYLCDDLGVESIELAIYNYDRQSGSFSIKGDSCSLISDGKGHMVGILHSGMPKEGGSNHVTYVTPAWWATEQLKLKHPHADFNRTAF